MSLLLTVIPVFLLVVVVFPGYAQIQQLTDSTRVVVEKTPEARIRFKGLFQGRYMIALHDRVDVMGMQHPTGDFVNNTFNLKRVRFATAATISDRTEVNIMLNLAEFNSDPRNRVLENAYVSYRINRYLSLIGGQFRPAFGLENTFPIDIVKSIDFSNQYYAFGSNGWESFQVGAGLTGKYEDGLLPVSYALTISNGNNRNQISDQDNGKQFASRVVLGLSKKYQLNVGLNGGLGSVYKENVYAAGLDISTLVPLSKKFSLELQVEGKRGTNHVAYFATAEDARFQSLKDYQMRGWYVLPNLRYAINFHRLSSIELSCRYEDFDANFKISPNKRRTFIPMVSFEFLENYNARIQLALQLDRFQHEVPSTTTYNNSLFILQLQTRL